MHQNLMVGLQGQIPADHSHDLACRTVACNEFPNKSGSESQHGHPAIEAFHPGEQGGVPGAFCGESLAERFQGLVVVAVVGHGVGGSIPQEPMRMGQDRR